jgi:DNA repair exonuclease SbcCD ATPase subunit
LDKLRKKYASKIRTLEDRIARAEQKVDVERQQAEGAKLQTAISWGTTILSAVLGRKTFGVGTMGRAATAARGIERSRRQASDVSRAQQQLSRYEQQLEELELELEQEQDLINDKYDPLQEELDTMELKPRRADVDVRTIALGWAPFVVHEDGAAEALFV